MPPQSVEQRVERLEQKVSELEQLPARVAELGSQIAQLRGEMHAEFFAIRSQVAERATVGQLQEESAAIREELRETIRAIRGNGANLSLAKLHDEMRSEFAALRGGGDEGVTLGRLVEELQAIRGNDANLTLAKLHEEIAALRGEGGEGLTLAALRQEIRDGDEETHRLMRVLHEDLVQRIALIGENPPSGGAAVPRKASRQKKKG